MEEDTAAASQKLNADFAAALRRAIAGQQKGTKSEERKNKPSEQRVSKDRAERGQASLRRTKPRLFNRKGDDLARKPIEDGGPMARIQNKVKPVTNWEKGNEAKVPFSRVPYALPKVDLTSLKENLTKQNTPKTWHPLKEANRLLSLKPTSNNTLIQGGQDDPTPVARPGISRGAEPVRLVERKVGEKADEKTVSIAKEAREARIQAIRENIGGDYSRFDAKEFVIGKRQLANDVAQAVASNDDMAPTHKGFTAKSIHQILNQAGA